MCRWWRRRVNLRRLMLRLMLMLNGSLVRIGSGVWVSVVGTGIGEDGLGEFEAPSSQLRSFGSLCLGGMIDHPYTLGWHASAMAMWSDYVSEGQAGEARKSRSAKEQN